MSNQKENERNPKAHSELRKKRGIGLYSPRVMAIVWVLVLGVVLGNISVADGDVSVVDDQIFVGDVQRFAESDHENSPHTLVQYHWKTTDASKKMLKELGVYPNHDTCWDAAKKSASKMHLMHLFMAKNAKFKYNCIVENLVERRR